MYQYHCINYKICEVKDGGIEKINFLKKIVFHHIFFVVTYLFNEPMRQTD